MAVRDASSALTVATVANLYRDVWDFARRPTLAYVNLTFGRAFLFALAALFALDLALAMGSLYLEAGIASVADYEFPDPIDENLSLAEDLLFSVLLAPIIEEALFRGWLRGDVAGLRFAAAAWTALGLIIISEFVGEAAAIPLIAIGLLILIGGLTQWAMTRRRDTQVPDWFSSHFGKFVWGSTIAFGLIHLGNFEEINTPLDVILVSSQTIGGLILAYTRTRLGLGAAMAQHSAFNLLVVMEFHQG